jgi:hypothetical protein
MTNLCHRCLTKELFITPGPAQAEAKCTGLPFIENQDYNLSYELHATLVMTYAIALKKQAIRKIR